MYYNGLCIQYFHKILTFFFFSPVVDEEAARITSKHNLESYVYNLRNTLRKLEGAVNETTNWLDVSQKASKEEYEEAKTVLEEKFAEYVCFHFILPFC